MHSLRPDPLFHSAVSCPLLVSAAAFLFALILSTADARAAGPVQSHQHSEAAPAVSTPAPSAAYRPGLTRSDLLGMLDAKIGAGIILRQLERTGLAFIPEAADLVTLKKSGASDRLLEAVLAAPAGSARPSEEAVGPGGETGTRVFESTDARGRAILVLTNLDEAGRRLASESDVEFLPRIVKATAEPATTKPAPEASGAEDGAPTERGAGAEGPAKGQLVQVIVNAAPEQPAPAPPQSPAWPAGIANGGNACAYGGCNVISTGGAVGAFRYPDRLWFLGYKP